MTNDHSFKAAEHCFMTDDHNSKATEYCFVMDDHSFNPKKDRFADMRPIFIAGKLFTVIKEYIIVIEEYFYYTKKAFN